MKAKGRPVAKGSVQVLQQPPICLFCWMSLSVFIRKAERPAAHAHIPGSAGGIGQVPVSLGTAGKGMWLCGNMRGAVQLGLCSRNL